MILDQSEYKDAPKKCTETVIVVLSVAMQTLNVRNYQDERRLHDCHFDYETTVMDVRASVKGTGVFQRLSE